MTALLHRTSSDLASMSRAAQRKQRLLEIEKEQRLEDAEALKMTEEQRQTLLRSFTSVKVEFSDLDGLKWTHSALRKHMPPLHPPHVVHSEPSSPTSPSSPDQHTFVILTNTDLASSGPEDTIRASKSRPRLPPSSPSLPSHLYRPFPTKPRRAHRSPVRPPLVADADCDNTDLGQGHAKRRRCSPSPEPTPTQSLFITYPPPSSPSVPPSPSITDIDDLDLPSPTALTIPISKHFYSNSSSRSSCSTSAFPLPPGLGGRDVGVWTTVPPGDTTTPPATETSQVAPIPRAALSLDCTSLTVSTDCVGDHARSRIAEDGDVELDADLVPPTPRPCDFVRGKF